jgi:hypothetical protein
MKIRTAELTGPALDWAVAKCEGPNSEAACYYIDDLPVYLDEAPIQEWKPATNWAQGGPIIEREIHSITDTTMRSDMSFAWEAKIHVGAGLCVRMYGPTPLIAAMRCFVASKMGDTIDIPEELK